MDSRRVEVGCDFVYTAEVDTPAVFQVTPLGAHGVGVGQERWSLPSPQDLHEYRDLYGNRCHRIRLQAGVNHVSYRAVAEVRDATEDVDPTAAELRPDALPDETLVHLMPSRYCPSDVLADEAWSRFGALAPGYGRVSAICDHVNSHLEFMYGSTGPTSNALDVNLSGQGVCRDFAHLAISFCRALNIPARYVFGYLPAMDAPEEPEVDFAAWMEVWLGDRWWTFDPRNNTPRKGRILIGRGRDASDVAMVTTFGGPTLESMLVVAREI